MTKALPAAVRQAADESQSRLVEMPSITACSRRMDKTELYESQRPEGIPKTSDEPGAAESDPTQPPPWARLHITASP